MGEKALLSFTFCFYQVKELKWGIFNFRDTFMAIYYFLSFSIHFNYFNV